MPLADLLGRRDLKAFAALSKLHADGWGVAWNTGRGLAVRKSPDAARRNRDFATWVREVPADLGLVHLRRATLGLGVHAGNTHPFTAQGMAFAHNGSVLPPSSLDGLIRPELRDGMEGETDSERYFRAVLSRVADEGAVDRALVRTVDAVAAATEFSSLNCVLLTPDTLYAACRFRGTQEGQGPDYFHLGYRVTDDAVVVSSSGWGTGWQPLADGELLAVRRATLEVSVLPMEELLPAP